MTTDFPVEVDALTKTYRVGFWMNRQVQAVRGVTLRVPRGQIFGLLGPNGAGKSTTIKVLLNLVKPSSGAARVLGAQPGDAQARRRIGFVPENPAPYEYLTGKEFLALSGRLAGLSGRDLDTRVQKVLDDVEMRDAALLQIRRYSKGMVQRITLAQALIADPELLVLDEPTSGLDPIGRRQIRELILEQRRRGVTVLFCTHIIPDVEAICDRLAVIVDGRCVREGSVAELTQASAGDNQVELTIDGLELQQLQAMGVDFISSTQLQGRTLVRVSEVDSQRLLRAVVEIGGRVTSLRAVRFGIEELFMSAVKEGGRRVGSQVTS